jgi:hypothetical protein
VSHTETPNSQSQLTLNQEKPKRRLLYFLLTLLSAILITHALIHKGLRSVRTSHFGASNLLFDGEINAEIVVTGSSRALTHYDPKIISEVTGLTCFNLGRNGSQTDLQLAYLKAYLKHNTHPKLIIHNLDSFSLTTSKEIYDPAQYFPYIWESEIFSAISRVYPSTAWRLRYVPLYAYVVEDMRFTWTIGLRSLLNIQPTETLFRGFEAQNRKWTGDFQKFQKANQSGITFAIEQGGISELAELIGLCQKLRIPLVLSYSPVYIEMQKMEANVEKIFSEFTRLSTSGGAQLFDFRGSSICLDRTLFYNSQHLNAAGAQKFTQEFSVELKAKYPSLVR